MRTAFCEKKEQLQPISEIRSDKHNIRYTMLIVTFLVAIPIDRAT